MAPFFLTMKCIRVVILLFLIPLLNLTALAQNEIGDTWYYTLSEEYGPQRNPPLLYENAKMEICRDTQINGMSYFVVCLDRDDMCNPMMNGFLFRNDSGKVYVFNSNWQEEYLLYDFNLTAGAFYTFPTELSRDSLVIVKIDSVATRFVLGANRRVQFVSLQAPRFFDDAQHFFSHYPKQEHYIIEDIGSTVNYFMWWEGLCHKKRIYNLRCFTRSQQTYTHDTTFADACDSVFFWQPDGIEPKVSESVFFYPNPAQNHVHLSGYQAISRIEITDAQGRSRPGNKETIGSRIFVGDLPNGYYWVHITLTNGDFFATPLLILR